MAVRPGFERVDALVPILERLTVKDDQKSDLWSEAFRIINTYDRYWEDDRRRGKKKALSRLALLRTRLIAVNEVILDLPQEAHVALAREVIGYFGSKTSAESLDPHSALKDFAVPVDFVLCSVILVGLVEEAKKKLQTDPDPMRVARPRNNRAAAVAYTAAGVYERVTGKRATVRTRDGTAYGPYLDFVTELFIALAIDARPEGYARTACQSRRRAYKERISLPTAD